MLNYLKNNLLLLSFSAVFFGPLYADMEPSTTGQFYFENGFKEPVSIKVEYYVTTGQALAGMETTVTPGAFVLLNHPSTIKSLSVKKKGLLHLKSHSPKPEFFNEAANMLYDAKKPVHLKVQDALGGLGVLWVNVKQE